MTIDVQLLGTRIGRVRVLFRLPKQIHGRPSPSAWPEDPLAYIEWFTKPKPAAEDNHEMYAISKAPKRADGRVTTSIIPLSNIRQTCQLFPVFPRKGKPVDSSQTSDTVLDQCSSFLVNNWGSMYAYQTIW